MSVPPQLPPIRPPAQSAPMIRRPWREVLPQTPGPAAAIPGAVLLILGGWILALEIGVLTE